MSTRVSWKKTRHRPGSNTSNRPRCRQLKLPGSRNVHRVSREAPHTNSTIAHSQYRIRPQYLYRIITSKHLCVLRSQAFSAKRLLLWQACSRNSTGSLRASPLHGPMVTSHNPCSRGRMAPREPSRRTRPVLCSNGSRLVIREHHRPAPPARDTRRPLRAIAHNSSRQVCSLNTISNKAVLPLTSMVPGRCRRAPCLRRCLNTNPLRVTRPGPYRRPSLGRNHMGRQASQARIRASLASLLTACSRLRLKALHPAVDQVAGSTLSHRSDSMNNSFKPGIRQLHA